MIKNFILIVLCLGGLHFAYSQEKVRTKPGTEEEENEQADQRYKNTTWYKQMQKPNADFFSIQKKYHRYLQRHPQGEGPRETGESWFRNNIYYLDHKGRVQAPPPVDYLHLRTGVASGSTVTDTMAGDWHITGPRNQTLPNQFTRGGYSYCVRMDPTNTQKMFISFLTGGLWVSSNGGITWHLSDANMPDNFYYDIDVCAANTNIVYAISKDAVIKSTDGGETWAVTGLNKSVAAYAATQGCDIAVAPDNANIVVARWGKTLYRTTDGGTTWTSVLASLNNFTPDGGTNNSGAILEWSHNNNNQVFYIDAVYGAATATVYASTDQGANFSSLANITIPADIPAQNLTSVDVVSATDQPTLVFAFLNSGYAYSQLYKIDATTGAVTLARKNVANNQKCDVIAMDINHSNNIIFGGYGEQIVHYSTDTGQTFTNSGQIHYDIRSIDIVNGKAMVGNDGEITVSTNQGATFSNVSASISNIELWGFSASFKSDILAAACNHGPLMVRDYAANGGWYSLLGADQQNTDINPLDSVHIISRGYDAYYVTRTGIGTFTSISGQLDPGREDWFGNLSYHPNLYNTIESHTAGNFPQPEQSNPTGERLTWRNSLLKSYDNGLTINTLVHTFTDRLMTEKICMRDTNRIYCIVSPTNNHLWKTADGGVNWTEITPGTAVTGTTVRNISDVAVSDLNPDEIWVTYSGVQNTCKVLHSTDGGATYTNLTTTKLGADVFRKIIYQRGTNGGVYVGNKSGIFYRNNTMSDWQLLGNGLPMLDVRNMFINYYKGKLLIGTSRGAWDHDLYEHSSTVAQISASTKYPSCQYPTVQFRDYSVVSSGGTGATYSWQFPGGTPATSTSETPLVSYLGAASGSYNVTLTVTDQYGTSTHTLPGFITYTASGCCDASAPGWTSEDIGNPSIAGTTCYQSSINRFTVQASGSDVWNTADQFRYNDTALNGNGQIIAKVVSVNGANAWTKAGVMIRETTATGSKNVFVTVTKGNSVNMQYRTTTGGSSASVQGAAGITAPYWVKLIRAGNVFTSYTSPNGINWTLLNTVTISMNAAVRIGIGVTSHDNTQLATAVFDSVSVSPSCIAIVTQPVSSTTCIGSNATFSTTVAGSGNTYQWLSNNGNGWFNEGDGNWGDGAVTGSSTATLVKSVNESTQNGRQWRLQVTNATCGTILSNPVTLTVTGAVIASQPVSATACIGSNAIFTAAVSGTGNVYQWQTYQGGSWVNETDGAQADGDVAGAATPTLTKAVNANTANGRQWRLLVTNGTCNALVSNTVALTVTGAAITTQPASATANVGATVTFSATVAGTGNTYQWETNKGTGWYNEADGNWADGAVTGSNTASLAKTVNAYTQNGRRWRLKITGGTCPQITSDSAVLTITSGTLSAMKSMNQVETITVYPNPTHSVLNIAGLTAAKTISVYNSAGVLVYQEMSTGTSATINTVNWGDGAYVVKVMGADGKAQTFKVIKTQ